MLDLPLSFAPVYHVLVWGGRRMEQWRSDLPAGPVGESWDLADHPRGMSVVADGPHAGKTLQELTRAHGRDLVGPGFSGGDFPLMIKLIDANDRLSVQVHPDDALAQSLGVAARGKTECWFMLADGGALYSGCVPGTDRAAFASALAAGTVDRLLAQHPANTGDFFFLPARTVHALGAGCLLYEVQQTCDVTFRLHDWGRVGLDGKPRQLHVQESLATIDFSASSGATGGVLAAHPAGGQARPLASCPYFTVEERRIPAGDRTGGGGDACCIVICHGGSGRLATAAGAVPLAAMQTRLVPWQAGTWTAEATTDLRLLIATPRW